MTYFYHFWMKKSTLKIFDFQLENDSVQWVKNFEFLQRISIIQKSLNLANLSLNDVFLSFLNEKIHFERKWLSVQWVKNFEFLQRVSIIQKSLFLAILSLNDVFLSFLNKKIHFENFRFSARKWLSVQLVINFEFLRRISIIKKSLYLAFLSLNEVFLSFLNEKIHFENFRFSAQNHSQSNRWKISNF